MGFYFYKEKNSYKDLKASIGWFINSYKDFVFIVTIGNIIYTFGRSKK